MINNLESFLKEANALLAALSRYNDVTDKLNALAFPNLDALKQDRNNKEEGEKIVVDMSLTIDNIDSLIQERDELQQRAEVARNAMSDMIDEFDNQEGTDADFIKAAFDGKTVSYSLKGDESLAVDVIHNLLEVQKDILSKDKEILVKLSQKKNEIKSTLRTLQDDKKKLDFMNVNSSEQQEIGFNA